MAQKMRKVFTSLLIGLLIIASTACQNNPSEVKTSLRETAAAVTVAAMVRALGVPYTQTAIVKTVVSQMTQTAEVTRTQQAGTTSSSVTPSPSAGTMLPSPAYTLQPGVCNWVGYIADVTYPDGSQVEPGAYFRKTWRIQNLGNCTWNSSYWLTFDSGTQMGAPAYTPLTLSTVPPGGVVDVSVDMYAPTTAGTYQAIFRIRAPDGSIVPVNNHGDGSLWALIVVNVPQPCNWAGFIADITYPDYTRVQPNEIFNKVWRIQNIGTCTWSTNYSLIFSGGDRLGAPDFTQLSRQAVPPGSVVDVSIKLTAPNALGTYQAFFRFQAADGKIFGTGSNANNPIWVKIVVAPTPTPTPVPTSSPTSIPSSTPTPTATNTPTPTLTPTDTDTPSPTPT